MKRTAVLVALAVLSSVVLAADPAEEAEAKRRGVPVSLVQAEKALAAEKAKTADLEKQLAALKQQLGGLATTGAANAGGLKVPPGAKVLTLDLGGNVSLNLLQIPAGKFTMGAAPGQKKLRDELGHEVTISKPFYMGMTLVTVDQFSAFIKATGFKTEAEKEGVTEDKILANGSLVGLKESDHTWRTLAFAQTGDHPVVNISWNDAQAYCAWLKAKSGKGVSLPTEAQWEWAERGGTKTEYIWGDAPDKGKGWANCAGAEVDKLLPRQGVDYNYPCFSWNDGFVYTSPVGSFKPNGYGLYDMVGNASEWCLDEWEDYKPGPVTDPLIVTASGDGRIVRGGSWLCWEDDGRSAHRGWGFRDSHDSTYGMRIVINE